MPLSVLREKVIEEIEQIPERKLSEVYTLLHFFRLGIETAQRQPHNIMRFAGCWQDMPDDEFQDFLHEIQERRQHAFSGRIAREAIVSSESCGRYLCRTV